MLDLILFKFIWKDDEIVFDIGSGLGLYMIEAEKYPKTGKSYGFDIWRVEDLSDNTIEYACQKPILEGVREVVETKNDDAHNMSLANNLIDVVLSMLCIHDIDENDEQEKACL